MADPNIDKLKLEIEELQLKNKWEPVSRFIPVIAALVAAAGLFVSVVKYQSDQTTQQNQLIREQEKDRASRKVDQELRLQNQIRADIDQVLQFAHDPNQTIARASFLLDDITTLLPAIKEKQTISEAVTRSLVQAIAYDCDFINKPRDVGFTEMVIEQWQDYSVYLRKDQVKLNFILYKYVRALRDLTDSNPGYFKTMTYDDSTDDYVVLPKYEKMQANEEQHYQHFLDIAQGFRKHIDAIGEDSESQVKATRDKNVQQFEAALCNEKVEKEILGVHFKKNVPCEE